MKRRDVQDLIKEGRALELQMEDLDRRARAFTERCREVIPKGTTVSMEGFHSFAPERIVNVNVDGLLHTYFGIQSVDLFRRNIDVLEALKDYIDDLGHDMEEVEQGRRDRAEFYRTRDYPQRYDT